jgi:Fe-S-cluster containining protein
MSDPAEATTASPCQSCGACCAYSQNWPRFTVEEDESLDLIPPELVNDRLSGMRCENDRCCALQGKIGEATACGIYALRPEVCRTCMPGDAECAMARRKFGLPALA